MSAFAKRTGIVLLAALLAVCMVAPALSFAEMEPEQTMTGLMDASDVAAVDSQVEAAVGAPDQAADVTDAITDAATPDQAVVEEVTPGQAASGEPPAAGSGTDADASDPAATPAGDCTATIMYLENPVEDDEGKPTDEDGRVILGTHTVTGLHEGEVLHAWDYVVDIPGHFFFDGWPLDMTVSKDPSQNVMKLIYFRLWNSEYTVNYYVMTGADLTADNWNGALSTGDVEFHKMGSETFENQQFDSVVEGDAYEYKLDGMYVIDTYPAQIRLTEDPDNNVINVLYTSTLAHLPDDIESPDDLPAEDTKPGDLPDDGTFDKDEITGVLPDDDEIYEDFIGSDVGAGELVVTDEMLANPVDKNQAITAAKAYQTGLHAAGLSQTGDALAWAFGGLAVVVAAAAVGIVVVTRQRNAEPIEVKAD